MSALTSESLGFFKIRSVLGRGGVAEVLEVEGEGKRFAAKRLLPHLRSNSLAQEALLRELHFGRLLDHPRCHGATGFGRSPTGDYLILPLLEGVVLSELLVEPLEVPVPRAVAWVRDILDALEHVHSRGFVHGDLKPENIFLKNSKDVTLIDFGSSRYFGEARPDSGTSGTPEYMSPESALGGPIDARSDLYSLGILMFQMLTGRLPFEARTPREVLLLQVHGTTPSLDAVPPCLATTVHRLLEKKPENRFFSVRGVRSALLESRVIVTIPHFKGAFGQVTKRRRKEDPVAMEGGPSARENL